MNTNKTHIAGHPIVRFGSGERKLVIIPGLSDALQGEKLSRFTRLVLERSYLRAFAREFDVYVVSRPRELSEGVTTRALADGYAEVLDNLGKANVVGISMGGLIAQYLAVDHPQGVEALVIALAGPRLSEGGRSRVSEWLEAARSGRWAEVYVSSVESTYSSRSKQAIYGAMFKLPGLAKEPPFPNDFVRSAQACLDHDATGELESITARTLVLGGEQDVLFDAEALREMAAKLPNGDATILEDTGHGAFEERRREFTQEVTHFLRADR